MSELEIRLLLDEATAEVIAKWQYEEWGTGYQEMQFADFLREIERSILSREIPVIFAAMIGGEIVGTASIIDNDLPSRMDINPWLASIFVRQDYRNRGIASALIKTPLEHARLLEIDRLYLFTHDLESVYNKYGFTKVDCGEFMGQKVSIMVYSSLRVRY